LSRFKRLELYHDICRPVGTNFVMKLFLPSDGTSAGFVLESGRRDFTKRDRDLLDLLAPYLVLIRRQKQAGARSASDSEALAALTARERQVLQLVADGMTNPEIAAALFLATGTVRKHLDNVYRKLGVRGRAAAVAVTQLTRHRASSASSLERPPH
jgi:DNA-binding CsgD family transcriptional regulator